jgi:peptidoglycan hydrolase CwlO-like protein
MMTISRDTVNRVVKVAAIVGIVLSVAATVIAYILVGRLEGSVRDSLNVTTQAIDTVDGSITVTQQTISTLSEALDSIGTSTSTVHDSLTTSSSTFDTVHSLLSDSLPSSIDAVNQVLPTVADAAHAMDTALRDLSKLPFGPNYNPKVAFDEAIQQLADSLSGLPGDLKSLAGDVATLQTSTATLDSTIGQFGSTINSLKGNLTDAKQAVANYVTTAGEARRVATNAKHDVNVDTTIARVLTIVLGLLFVILQAVALWIIHLTYQPVADVVPVRLIGELPPPTDGVSDL